MFSIIEERCDMRWAHKYFAGCFINGIEQHRKSHMEYSVQRRIKGEFYAAASEMLGYCLSILVKFTGRGHEK